MYRDENLDIIFQVAGLTGIGAIEAAKELRSVHYVIGVDQDQSGLTPNNILTSLTKDIGGPFTYLLSDYIKNKSFPEGSHIYYGLKEGIVGILKNENMISPELL